MDKDHYFQLLYPLQDVVLAKINRLQTGFYLSGGTAASRGYLQHRFSDDLDFFVNDDEDFKLWSERMIQAMNQPVEWHLEVIQKEERFVRLDLTQEGVRLKLELVNDVPAHVGAIVEHPVLGRIDSAENILANKLTALLDREEPKDLADVWGFCSQMGLSLKEALSGARSKAAGIFPVDLARVLLNTCDEDLAIVHWIDRPDFAKCVKDLHTLGEKLLLLDEG